jgi:hypothetical protein
MTSTDRDVLILEAAIEFGADYFYDIKNGTMGQTLYINAPNKLEASYIRKEAPSHWKDLYVVVLYNTAPDFEKETLYDPKLS